MVWLDVKVEKQAVKLQKYGEMEAVSGEREGEKKRTGKNMTRMNRGSCQRLKKK